MLCLYTFDNLIARYNIYFLFIYKLYKYEFRLVMCTRGRGSSHLISIRRQDCNERWHLYYKAEGKLYNIIKLSIRIPDSSAPPYYADIRKHAYNTLPYKSISIFDVQASSIKPSSHLHSAWLKKKRIFMQFLMYFFPK